MSGALVPAPCTDRQHRLRGSLAGAVLVALVAMFGVGAPPAGATSSFPPERPTRVLILGDSVLAGTAGQYGRRLSGRDVTVDAVVSRTTAASADRLAQLGSNWDVVIVLLGYNDGGSARAFQPAANRILDQLAAVPRITWLSLHEVRPGYAAVNRYLTSQLARRPNLRTADWNAICNAYPGALAGDGIHPKGVGPGLLADLVTAQVVQAEADREAEVRAAAQAAEEARLRAETEAQVQALRDIADAQQRAVLESAIRAQQEADAVLARQRAQIAAWEVHKAELQAQIAREDDTRAREVTVRNRRYQRIARSVAHGIDARDHQARSASSVAVIGLAILATTGAGTTALITRRRRRAAT